MCFCFVVLSTNAFLFVCFVFAINSISGVSLLRVLIGWRTCGGRWGKKWKIDIGRKWGKSRRVFFKDGRREGYTGSRGVWIPTTAQRNMHWVSVSYRCCVILCALFFVVVAWFPFFVSFFFFFYAALANRKRCCTEM